MESTLGCESFAKQAVVSSMIQAYENEIQAEARISHLLKQRCPEHPAWYGQLLVNLGKRMVSLGAHLMTH